VIGVLVLIGAGIAVAWYFNQKQTSNTQQDAAYMDVSPTNPSEQSIDFTRPSQKASINRLLNDIDATPASVTKTNPYGEWDFNELGHVDGGVKSIQKQGSQGSKHDASNNGQDGFGDVSTALTGFHGQDGFGDVSTALTGFQNNNGFAFNATSNHNFGDDGNVSDPYTDDDETGEPVLKPGRVDYGDDVNTKEWSDEEDV